MEPPELPADPLDELAAAAERARREVRRLVRLYGRSRQLVPAVRSALDKLEPAVAAELNRGQLLAWVQSARSMALDLPRLDPFRLPAPGRSPSFNPDLTFPQVTRAAQVIQAKAPFTPAEWERLGEDAKKVGFTVARAQNLEAVERVQRALRDDILDGGTLDQFRDRVDGAVGSVLSDSQVEAVYRTHVGRAYSAGQVAMLDSPAVRSAFPYLRYYATHDSRVRPDHLALETAGLNGTGIYRSDDPIWDRYYPPWAWNCRCHVVPYSLEDAAAEGVEEAAEWLRTGRPPRVPQFVPNPGFPLPKGWVPTGRRLSALG